MGLLLPFTATARADTVSLQEPRDVRLERRPRRQRLGEEGVRMDEKVQVAL
jgi:hypothetical protein